MAGIRRAQNIAWKAPPRVSPDAPGMPAQSAGPAHVPTHPASAAVAQAITQKGALHGTHGANPALAHAPRGATLNTDRFEGVKAAAARATGRAATMPAGVFDAPLPERGLPPLAEAMTDARILPLAPGSMPVPDHVLSMLSSAKKVLVVGHVPPDGDAVGAALGLSRALQAMGKSAHACIDMELPGRLAGMDPSGELRRSGALDDDYDLVVMVDVAQGNRVGKVGDLLENAPNVLVIDHHHAEGTRDEAKVGDTGRFETWIQPETDSAALMIGAAVERLEAHTGQKLDADTWTNVAAPLAAGTLTDTDFFRMSGADLDALRMVKSMVQNRLSGELDAAMAPVTYTFPPDAAAQLTPHAAAGNSGVSLLNVGADSALMVAPAEATARALETAQKTDARTSMADVRGTLMDMLDARATKAGLAALVYTDGGQTKVSIRSRDADDACAMVDALFPGRGGGKPHVAAARPEGSVDDVKAQIATWMRQQDAQSALHLRLGRG